MKVSSNKLQAPIKPGYHRPSSPNNLRTTSKVGTLVFTAVSGALGFIGTKIPNSLMKAWILIFSALGFVSSGLLISNLRKDDPTLANEISKGTHDVTYTGGGFALG